MAYELDSEADEPLYQRAGREPLSDADEDAAVAAYLADFPDIAADELQRWGAERRIRQLNAEAKALATEEAEAAAADTTPLALRQAKAEALARERQEQAERDLAAARRALRVEPGVVRRGRGRPGWTPATFHAAYREARDRAGGLLADDRAIADRLFIGLQQFGRLVGRYGRPE